MERKMERKMGPGKWGPGIGGRAQLFRILENFVLCPDYLFHLHYYYAFYLYFRNLNRTPSIRKRLERI